MDDPNGVVIRAWSCPISWHHYVKWEGADAYCDESGCEHSNIELPGKPQVRRVVAPVPRSVVTIKLPGGIVP